MRPSPAAINWIKAFASSLPGGLAGNTDEQVVAAANAATVANPTPQGTAPKPYGFADLLGVLSQASVANVEAFPGISQLYDDTAVRANPRVLAAIALMSAAGRVTAAEASAMRAVVNATLADPSWPAKIGAAQANLGRALDTEDSATARAS